MFKNLTPEEILMMESFRDAIKSGKSYVQSWNEQEGVYIGAVLPGMELALANIEEILLCQ